MWDARDLERSKSWHGTEPSGVGWLCQISLKTVYTMMMMYVYMVERILSNFECKIFLFFFFFFFKLNNVKKCLMLFLYTYLYSMDCKTGSSDKMPILKD